MARPRKSIAELQLTGTYQAHPGRYKAVSATKPIIKLPIGVAPKHLQATERAIWVEVVKNAPEGLLGRPDRLVLEIATRMIAKIRTGEFKASDVGHTMRILSKLGMDPAARQKLNLEPPATPQPDTKSPWDELDELD